MLLDGEIDFLAGLARREDREALIGYPDAPMGNESFNLIAHDTDEALTSDPATLQGRRIGVLDSAMATTLKEFLQSRGVEAEVVLFRDYAPLFEAFDSQEVDVLAAEGDGAYGRSHARLLYAFGESDYYLCVSKAKPELLAQLNAAQLELSENEPNYIHSLNNKYYPVSIFSRTLSTPERLFETLEELIREAEDRETRRNGHGLAAMPSRTEKPIPANGWVRMNKSNQ